MIIVIAYVRAEHNIDSNENPNYTGKQHTQFTQVKKNEA